MKNRLYVALSVGFVACLLAGCETSEEERRAALLGPEVTDADVTDEAILDDLTPELFTLTERDIDAEANTARQFNNDWRQFWEDWGKVLLLDQPVRLNHRPIP